MSTIRSRVAASATRTQAEVEATNQGQPAEPSRREVRARFALKTRNNVRFAHAHHAHLQSAARSANARRLVSVLAKKRLTRKAASTRFSTSRSAVNTRPPQKSRDVDRQRAPLPRTNRNGSDSGSQGGGRGQREDKRRQDEDSNDDAQARDEIAQADHAGEFESLVALRARMSEGLSRHEAMAAAWCDRLLHLGAHTGSPSSLLDAMSSLHALRLREGSLPLGSVVEVRKFLMEATARSLAVRNRTVDEPRVPFLGATGSAAESDAHAPDATAQLRAASGTRNALAPLLALIAGGPVLPAREKRARSVSATLASTISTRRTRPTETSS